MQYTLQIRVAYIVKLYKYNNYYTVKLFYIKAT